MTIKLPLDNWKSGKNHTLNMNNYRNWHYRTSNTIKKKVLAYFKKHNPDIKKLGCVSVGYTLYFKDKRVCDLMNYASVADKFLLDCLVEAKIIKDDNYKIVQRYNYIKYGGLAEYNYIEMEIKEIDE